MLSYRQFMHNGPWHRYELNLNRTKISLAVEAYLAAVCK